MKQRLLLRVGYIRQLLLLIRLRRPKIKLVLDLGLLRKLKIKGLKLPKLLNKLYRLHNHKQLVVQAYQVLLDKYATEDASAL